MISYLTKKKQNLGDKMKGGLIFSILSLKNNPLYFTKYSNLLLLLPLKVLNKNNYIKCALFTPSIVTLGRLPQKYVLIIIKLS